MSLEDQDIDIQQIATSGLVLADATVLDDVIEEDVTVSDDLEVEVISTAGKVLSKCDILRELTAKS